MRHAPEAGNAAEIGVDVSYRVGYFMRANEGIYGVLRSCLPEGFELITLESKDPGEPLEKVRGLDFVIGGKVTGEMIANAPKLRFIQAPGVGYDGIDVEAAASRGIPAAVSLVGNSDEVAEHVFLLMLAVNRRLREMDQSVRDGRWLMWDRRLQSFNLAGKTIGIIGLGRIGQEVAGRARGFKMEVRYHDPAVEAEYSHLPLDELLGESDYITIHVPLTPGTRGLLDARRIGLLKEGGVLVNTSRGEIVDEPALVEALKAGRLRGAGLDVFDREPPSADNPLFALENVVLTPHVGSGTVDGLRAKAAMYAGNITRVLAGEDPIGLIPASRPAPADGA